MTDPHFTPWQVAMAGLVTVLAIGMGMTWLAVLLAYLL